MNEPDFDQKPEMKEVYFSGASEKCDVCEETLLDHPYMVDGTLDSTSRFFFLCPLCFLQYGKPIGYGSGQLYRRTEDQRWLLVAGGPPEDGKEKSMEERVMEFLENREAGKSDGNSFSVLLKKVAGWIH